MPAHSLGYGRSKNAVASLDYGRSKNGVASLAQQFIYERQS
jgi:hypothetical protein